MVNYVLYRINFMTLEAPADFSNRKQIDIILTETSTKLRPP